MLSSYEREKLVEQRQTEMTRQAELMRTIRVGGGPSTSDHQVCQGRSQYTVGQSVKKPRPVLDLWARGGAQMTHPAQSRDVAAEHAEIAGATKTDLSDQLESLARRSWHALVHLLHLTPQANPKVEMLRRIYLFASCSERELGFLARQADAVQAPAGEVLTVASRPPDTFYMLLEGLVRVMTAGEADVQYGPGAAFDVVAMAERSPARATITAQGPVRMLVMSHAQFRAVAALPRLQDALWRVTSPVAVAPPLRPRQPAPARVARTDSHSDLDLSVGRAVGE